MSMFGTFRGVVSKWNSSYSVNYRLKPFGGDKETPTLIFKCVRVPLRVLVRVRVCVCACVRLCE